MLRKALVVLCLIALASPAYAITWDGAQSNSFTITLNIEGYCQLLWQDAAIEFSDVLGVDWYSTQLRGLAYVSTSDYKIAGDPWSGWETGGRYFESYDAAYLYLKTNTDIMMTVTPNGNLANNGWEIPTWFTLAASGPFTLAGTELNDGTIPADGIGSYAADEASAMDGVMELGGTAFFPNQFCFPMDLTGETFTYWTLDLDAPSSGNLLFHARIHRNALSDMAGSYSTTIDVAFSE